MAETNGNANGGNGKDSGVVRVPRWVLVALFTAALSALGYLYTDVQGRTRELELKQTDINSEVRQMRADLTEIKADVKALIKAGN